MDDLVSDWRPRAGYADTFAGFLRRSPAEIRDTVQDFAARLHRIQYTTQFPVWGEELRVFRAELERVVTDKDLGTAGIVIEFGIPRRGRFIDALLLVRGTVLVLEFKTQDDDAKQGGVQQARDYALDLRDFHALSQARCIVPVAVPLASTGELVVPAAHRGVTRAIVTSPDRLADLISVVAERDRGSQLDVTAWVTAPYSPTPNILEAADAIFSGHTVREIAHAAADDALETVSALRRVILDARSEEKRVLAVVTGVPGAGKTLVGLTLVHQLLREDIGAVFLSGNGPLVEILVESLARDRAARGVRKEAARREITATVQSVMRFLREHVAGHSPPENVIIFDEAQRAWNRSQMTRQNASEERLHAAEPELLLDVMTKRPGWSVVVALVGGGQEIFDGEAGMEAWGDAVSPLRQVWNVIASPDALAGGISVVGRRLFRVGIATGDVAADEDLHLRTSIRSIRAKAVTEWVHAVVSGDSTTAAALMPPPDEYPVELTRSLEVARHWLRTRGGDDLIRPGSVGLVASSDAMRLRAHGVEISNGFKKGYPWADWFTRGSSDVRSSAMLEVAASEFEVQGLELDWVGVCWGGDFLRSTAEWRLRSWRGGNWRNVKVEAQRAYLVNRYRVLLTRARRGMVIWVPLGNSADTTQEPGPLDTTAAYLLDCGIRSLDADERL